MICKYGKYYLGHAGKERFYNSLKIDKTTRDTIELLEEVKKEKVYEKRLDK